MTKQEERPLLSLTLFGLMTVFWFILAGLTALSWYTDLPGLIAIIAGFFVIYTLIGFFPWLILLLMAFVFGGVKLLREAQEE